MIHTQALNKISFHLFILGPSHLWEGINHTELKGGRINE